ncbi:MAG: 4'-phosphopantetheinyl transferase family protein [Bilifractor sp.]|jgi:phosphopantetheinyl transferase (holo-ACP synthase)
MKYLQNHIVLYLFRSERLPHSSGFVYRALGDLLERHGDYISGDIAPGPKGSVKPEDLSCSAGWELREERYGKPYFAGHPEICFSLSDSDGFVAVGFDSSRIGVDLQVHRRRKSDTREELAFRCSRIGVRAFHPLEQSYMNVAEKPDAGSRTERSILRFFRIWSAKEAYVKYTGTGIGEGFSRFSSLPEDLSFSDQRVFRLPRDSFRPGGPEIEMEWQSSWEACGVSFSLLDFRAVTGEKLRYSLCVASEQKKSADLVLTVS